MKKQSVFALTIASSLLASTTVAFADGASVTSSTTVSTKPFSDVETSSPYVNYIADLKQKSILAGNPDGTFGPSDSLTRAQFAVMLVKAFNLPTNSNPTKFVDSQNHWGKVYIEAAYEAGVVAGTSDTTFSPEQTLTREQAAAMVWRYLKVHGVKPTTNVFTTAGTDDWAKEAVQNIVSYTMHGPNEVTVNASGQPDYQSTQTMTRQSAAALIDIGLRYLDQMQSAPSSTSTYINHAGDNMNPVQIERGLTVKFDNPDGTLNRTTSVVDILNPSDKSNILYDVSSGSYKLGNIPQINVVCPESQYKDVMQTFTDQMNAGAKLFSQITFTSQGQSGITINFPSTAGTQYVWKYFDDKGQISVVSGSSLNVPIMGFEGVRFQFFLDNDPTPGVMKNYFGRCDIINQGSNSFSSVFGIVDIN